MESVPTRACRGQTSCCTRISQKSFKEIKYNYIRFGLVAKPEHLFLARTLVHTTQRQKQLRTASRKPPSLLARTGICSQSLSDLHHGVRRRVSLKSRESVLGTTEEICPYTPAQRVRIGIFVLGHFEPSTASTLRIRGRQHRCAT